jgi:hypothetical protein
MKPVFALFVPLLLALSVGAQGQLSDSAANVSKLIAIENAWNMAQLHYDAKALDSLMGDKFVYTDYDGTVMNKAGFVADLKDPSYAAKLMVNSDVAVHIYQNAAVVIGAYHTRGTYKGKPFDHRGRFTDMWIYHDNRWQCVASHTNLSGK